MSNAAACAAVGGAVVSRPAVARRSAAAKWPGLWTGAAGDSPTGKMLSLPASPSQFESHKVDMRLVLKQGV